MATSSAADQPKPSDAHAEPRRTSFSFLRRQKSNTGLAGRSTSGGKMSKKQKALAQEELLRQQREAAALPKQPPQLPQPPPLPTINTFGGENARPDSYQYVSRHAAGGYAHAPSKTTRPSMEYKTPTSPHAGVPIPPIPGSPSNPNGEYVDPYARTESMTHRGRYSYASSAVSTLNSPRRVRRRKDPTPFNILVIGAKNAGKTSFINFLRTSLMMPKHKRVQTPPPQPAVDPESPFTSQYLETEIENERVGVTLWDSQGLEKNVVDLQLREMATFIESKFEETFSEEQKVVRAAGVRDTHIHCVFLLLDPVRLDANVAATRGTTPGKFAITPSLVGSLDEDLDLQVLRILQGKTAVIPVIGKADTITAAHMAHLKKSVWDSLKQAKLDPLEALSFSDSDDESALDERDEDEYEGSEDEEEKEEGEKQADVIDNFDKSDSNASDDESSTSASSPPPKSPHSANSKKHSRRVSTMSAQIDEEEEEPFIPLSVISPDMYEPNVIGRRFAWGFADPMNPEHCDFLRLKESVFGEWRAELREASRERWYEGWRTSRLKRRTGGAATPRRNTDQYGSSPNLGNGIGSPVNPASYRSMAAY